MIALPVAVIDGNSIQICDRWGVELIPFEITLTEKPLVDEAARQLEKHITMCLFLLYLASSGNHGVPGYTYLSVMQMTMDSLPEIARKYHRAMGEIPALEKIERIRNTPSGAALCYAMGWSDMDWSAIVTTWQIVWAGEEMGFPIPMPHWEPLKVTNIRELVERIGITALLGPEPKSSIPADD